MDEQSTLKPSINRVHGSIIGSRLAFAEQHWGKEARQQLMDKLPLRERQLTESTVFENRWFEFSILDLLDQTILRNLAGDDHAILFQLGRFSAEYSYRRLPAQLTSLPPDEILRSTARINVLFQDFGEFQFEELEGDDQLRGMALIYRYPIEIPQSYCTSALGYFERLIELLGYKVMIVTEVQCQSRGDSAHRYEVWWEVTQVAQAVPAPQKVTGKFSGSAATGAQQSTGQFSLERLAQEQLSQKKPADPILKRATTGTFVAPQVVTRAASGLKRLTWRVWILSALILLVSAISVTQGLLYLLSKPQDLPITDKIRAYNCTGELRSELKVDKPYLMVRTVEGWADVKITTEGSKNKFTYTTKRMMANAVLEVGLGEFLSSENRPLDLNSMHDSVPASFSINALVNGQMKACSCRLEK